MNHQVVYCIILTSTNMSREKLITIYKDRTKAEEVIRELMKNRADGTEYYITERNLY